MTEYKAVPSGLELSRRIVECLETSAHRDYGPNERPRAIQRLNDILQGRSERNVDDLLVELDKCEDTRLPAIRGDIGAFLRQKELLTVPCVRHANQRPFKFQYCYVFEKRRLKIIDQMLYDRAVKEGFPADFFRESYFDYVTFYCLPDHVSFCSSELHNCKFAVCRIQGITFRYSRIYDTEFYSSVLNCGDMYEATLAHTHFHDCELSYMVFKNATLGELDLDQLKAAYADGKCSVMAEGYSADKKSANLTTEYETWEWEIRPAYIYSLTRIEFGCECR